jgi:class 3 adenylate cyclase
MLGEIERVLATIHAPATAERVLASVLAVCVHAGGGPLADLRGAFEREVARARGHAIPGDGASFVARFEGPGRAVQCGAALMCQARELRVRAGAGVHIGECERDAKAGPVFELAAALAASAEPHEVRVSRTVVDLVPGSGIAFTEGGVIGSGASRRQVWSVTAAAAPPR